MNQKIHIPKNPILKQIVNFIAYIELDSKIENYNWIAIFPNGTSNLCISLSSEKLSFNTDQEFSMLGASCSSAVALKRNNSLKFLNIQFSPFGMYYFKGIPMNEIQDKILSCDLLFRASEIESFRDKLLSSADLNSKFEAAEDFILSQMQPNCIDKRVTTAVTLLRNIQNISMDKLSEIACLSNRGLTKLFVRQVGLSPNYFKKLMRFNQAALSMYNNNEQSLTRIAAKHDYYDQSHFIKDFKQFARITPTQFLRDMAKSSDFYNFNLQELDKLDFS
ncbi:MAG: helix-turn-helix domain-containing protein [Pseudomonadales bacterium]|nr:helix-turn-helix domain-containing protein [Pseudomonadales bacterium]